MHDLQTLNLTDNNSSSAALKDLKTLETLKIGASFTLAADQKHF